LVAEKDEKVREICGGHENSACFARKKAQGVRWSVAGALARTPNTVVERYGLKLPILDS
jgi:hypothetical protein